MKRIKYPKQLLETLDYVLETVAKDLEAAGRGGKKYIEFDFSVIKDDTANATMTKIMALLLMNGYEVGMDDATPQILYVFVPEYSAPAAMA